MSRVALKEIPAELRIGGLSQTDYNKLSLIRDYIFESDELEKILNVTRRHKRAKETKSIEEFLRTVKENPKTVFFFGLGKEDASFSLSGVAFHVEETGRNLAIGTLSYPENEEQDIFNLNMIYREKNVDPLYKQYPIDNSRIYFYEMDKVTEHA